MKRYAFLNEHGYLIGYHENLGQGAETAWRHMWIDRGVFDIPALPDSAVVATVDGDEHVVELLGVAA